MDVKKSVYVVLTIFLGLLLGCIVHGGIEIVLINHALSRGAVLPNHALGSEEYCVLPLWLQIVLWTGGGVGGYFVGQYWWRVVYVEHRHWRMRKTIR